MSSKVARWLAMLLPFLHVMQAHVVSLKESVSTGNVQCDQNWLSSTSATLASPRGDAASLALRGQILRGKSSDDNRCLTTWSLNINTADSVETIVVGKRDDEWHCEHLFEMNGWSKDGKLLLMSMITDAGDWDETIPIVFDVRTRQVHRIELAPLFSKVTARSCSLYFRPLGFLSSGTVLLDVGPIDSDDLAAGEKPCFEEDRWELDYGRKLVKRGSPNSIPEKFGTVLKGK